jgi:DNA-directed RNA polymerase sigma subunit (sigma70/sigma32)
MTGNKRLSKEESQARLEDILQMRKDRWTLVHIGQKHGITKQRVSQIILEHHRKLAAGAQDSRS